MGDWDFDNEVSGDFSRKGSRRQGRKASAAGGLHIIMTISCLTAVAAVSFGIAYLMKDRVRSFWEMGLTFAAPFAALMFSSLLAEYKTNRMTPACSRKAQACFATGMVLVAFIFGCLAEVLHQPVIIQHAEPECDYVIVLDKSGSMVFTELDEPCRTALHAMMEDMEDESRVGIVAFCDSVMGSAEVRKLDESHRKTINKIIDTEIPISTFGGRSTGPGTDFSTAMDAAMSLVDRIQDRSRTVRIILVTDGDEDAIGDFNSFTQWAGELNAKDPSRKQVELCAIQLGDPMLPMVKEAVNATDGKVYDQTNPNELAGELKSLKSTLVIPEPVDTLKATFDGKTADNKPNTAYVILTAVLLFLLGLLCGLSLRIMFSLSGQFRVQVIISSLMGICAFLLLNFGRYFSVSPAWVCEGLAFTLFGLVFMRENSVHGAKMVTTVAVETTPFDITNDF